MRACLRNGSVLVVLLLAFQFQALAASTIDVVELKQNNSNKVVFKVRFNNGSVADAADKRGLTFATASLMAQGGAGGVSYADIQDQMMPWAASYFAAVDKQVTTFTFQVPVDFVDEFYPLLRNVLLAPDFEEQDFSRVIPGPRPTFRQPIQITRD